MSPNSHPPGGDRRFPYFLTGPASRVARLSTSPEIPMCLSGSPRGTERAGPGGSGGWTGPIGVRSPTMVLVLDNFDSFVWNIVHAAARAAPEARLEVLRSDRIDAAGALE